MPHNLIWTPLTFFFLSAYWQNALILPCFVSRIYEPWYLAVSSNTTEEPSIVKKINVNSPADHDSAAVQNIQTVMNWKQVEKCVEELCTSTDKAGYLNHFATITIVIPSQQRWSYTKRCNKDL